MIKLIFQTMLTYTFNLQKYFLKIRFKKFIICKLGVPLMTMYMLVLLIGVLMLGILLHKKVDCADLCIKG